jgi:hypothetical protein
MNSTNKIEESHENSGSESGMKKRSGGSFFRWFGRNRRIQAIFFILVLSLPLFLIIYGIVLPVKDFKPAPSSPAAVTVPDINTESSTVSIDDTQLSDVKKIIQKENEKAYQHNRLALAEKDSIYMILNVPDSLLILEIKGVTVKKTRLLDLEMSKRFALISHENLLPWISEPFTLESNLSTIPKEPIIIKQAPKDTIEAAKMSSKPHPPDSTNVFYTFYFDRNLVLEIEQADPPQSGATEKVINYRKIKSEESKRSILQMLKTPEQTDQPMMIKMVISEIDARAIYRAVPSKTRLILKL